MLSHLYSQQLFAIMISILQMRKLRLREVKKLASSSFTQLDFKAGLADPKSMFLLTLNALPFLLKENKIQVWPESLAGLEQCPGLGMRISHSQEMAWAKAQGRKNRGCV